MVIASRARRATRLFVCCFLLAASAGYAVAAQPFVPQDPVVNADGSMVGRPSTGEVGIVESVARITARQIERGSERAPRRWIEHEPWRRPVDNPLAPAVARWPMDAGEAETSGGSGRAPQTVSTTFLGATLNDTGAFPPDTMGAVGPTQFIVAVNGRIRSFDKNTGLADGVLNFDMDVFFASVMSPQPGTFTSDPRIRYDRLSQRWFVIIIDVPAGTGAIANKVLLAVSSGPTVTNVSNFTFFSFTPSATLFADYPTLGVDANALYIGTNDFTLAGAFSRTSGFVVRKSSMLNIGPIVVTALPALVPNQTSAGPFTPQGVDTWDVTTEGYFVGVDNAAFSVLQVRRVTDPGGTPAVSANLPVTVPTTTFPTRVPHLGNTGGANGGLDSLDDRLFAATLRNGRLWTAHNIRVNSSGVANTGTGARVATRWYELQNLATTPSLAQSGTIFDSAASNPVAYFIPSVMVSGQGHAAFGFTSAGNNARANAATVGRLQGAGSGTTQGPPVNYTDTTFAYNPPSDPGGAGGRRWGDYSYTSLDPCDDMTMWTIQQFTQALNIYGVQAAKLLAPAPTVSCAAATEVARATTADVVVTGTGFYDPPAGADACRVGIAASAASGITVNSVTYDSPTSVTLNVSVSPSASLGANSITVTNPDGQSASDGSCLEVVDVAATTITSLTRSSPNPVCATNPVSWQATFAQPVTGLAPGNFALNGGVGASVSSVAGSDATWTVNASSGTAAGTLGLSLANSAGVTPPVANTPFTDQSFTVVALPQAFQVNGGGTFCSGGSGVTVGLAGSQSGVSYQLRRDGGDVGAPVVGNGAAISFGAQTVAGSYTVAATNSDSCGAAMTGSVNVTVDQPPTLNPVTPAPICTGGTTNIALSSTPPGSSFAWSAALTSGTVSGFAGGSGGTIAQTLTGAGQVTYTVSPTLGTCTAGGTPIVQGVSDPAIAQTTLANGAQTVAYNQALTAPNAIGGVSFTVTSGALPPGLNLAVNGVISGTPTADGEFAFTVTAAGVGVPGCNAQRSYTIRIGDLLLRDGFEDAD